MLKRERIQPLPGKRQGNTPTSTLLTLTHIPQNCLLSFQELLTPVGDLGRLPMYDCVFVCGGVHVQTMKVGGVYVWNWPEGTRAEGTGQREWRPCQAELPADLSAHAP